MRLMVFCGRSSPWELDAVFTLYLHYPRRQGALGTGAPFEERDPPGGSAEAAGYAFIAALTR